MVYIILTLLTPPYGLVDIKFQEIWEQAVRVSWYSYHGQTSPVVNSSGRYYVNGLSRERGEVTFARVNARGNQQTSNNFADMKKWRITPKLTFELMFEFGSEHKFEYRKFISLSLSGFLLETVFIKRPTD